MRWGIQQRFFELGPDDGAGGSSHRRAAPPVHRDRLASGVLLGSEGQIPARARGDGTIPLSSPTALTVPGHRGIIIELFGPAASGKTTLARALEAALDSRGIAVRLVGSSRPVEKGPRPPEAGTKACSTLTAPLARASKLFSALGALMPGASIDPLVGKLMKTLPPRSWGKALRVRRYLRNLCRSWSAARTSDSVVVFDQGFMNSLCSLALFSGAVDQYALSRGLSLVPVPDLLIRVETPREVLQARLEKRLHRQGVFERRFESDIQMSLRQIELSSIFDRLLAERGRHPVLVSWRDRDGLATAVEAIADEIMSRRGRGDMARFNARSPDARDAELKEPKRLFSAAASGTVRPGMDSVASAAGSNAVGEPGITPAVAREPVRRLLDSLDRMGVRYCHWKSNIRLAASLDGAGDLDLLVDRQHAGWFHTALVESGFKTAVSGSGAGHPGVFHAFALDPDLSELIHLHAYFQIVTGDSLVKAYHLPFEETLLANTRRLHSVPVPAAAAELVLFTLRIALKHTSLAELLLVSRHYAAVPQELDWLRAAADLREAEALWAAWLPGVSAGLFHDLMEAIAEPGAVARRIRLGRRVARRLRGWRRLDPLSAAISRMRRIAIVTLRGRRPLTPSAAGVMIAFVGPKATGKSTLSAAAARSLGRHFHVCRVHVGKPPATAASLLPRLALPLVRRLLPGQRSSGYENPERGLEKRYSLLNVAWLTVLAHDRRALLRRCWRHATAGTIVIADRYPSATIGAIDSSRFDDAALAQCTSRLKRWLMQRERALYAGLPQPRLVIRLTAPIETTIRRDAERDKEEGPDPTAVERRRKSETETEYPGARVITVDTDQPLSKSLKTVIQAIWAAV